MDEPTASLTRTEVGALLGFVERLRAQGVAVVFVSHRLDEVVEIAERVTVLRDGRKVGTFASGEVDARRIGELMTGLSIEHAITARDVAAARAAAGGARPDPGRRVRRRRPSPCAGARCWGSPGCSAPAGPSWRCRCSA